MDLRKIPEEELFDNLSFFRLSELDVENTPKSVCPSCKTDDSYIVDKFHRIGFCSSCQTFVQLKAPEETKHTKGLFEWDKRSIRDIMCEAEQHLDNKFCQMELEAFGLTEDLLKDHGIGFYPYSYWVERDTDWKFGKLLFPMTTFEGEPVNIVAKSVGKKDRVAVNDTQVLYPKNPTVFNYMGWFHSVVNVFSDPVDVLIALQNDYKNSILFSSRVVFPEGKVLQSKINVFLNGGVEKFPFVNILYYAKKYGVKLNVFDVSEQKENISAEILETVNY